MTRFDARGCAVSGATANALDAWELALADVLAWRAGADARLEAVVAEAPDFVMARVLQAWLLLAGRDPARARRARPVLERARRLRANTRERAHLAAIGAMLNDEYERAKTGLAALLRAQPRDVLALHVAQGLDYLTGDVDALAARPALVRPHWSPSMPGFHAVLAMHAFGLEERDDLRPAERLAHEALRLDRRDARACHVIAHVHEATGRAAAGERWLCAHAGAWANGTVVATHAWWHVALFQLEQKRPGTALATYDAHVRPAPHAPISDLLDGSALLWRLQLADVDAHARWHELADAWSPHIDDRFCTFNDVHAMLAFVGAGDHRRADRLERTLRAAAAQPSRHGDTTRQIGLPACRAVRAFARGDDARALALLASLPPVAHRIGGSHAQRDVLNLTLQRVVQRLRRMRPPARVAVTASVAA